MGTVDDYLDGLDPADREVVGRIYAVARTAVPDTAQGKGYGMPALTYRGSPLLSVMRTKKHIGLYPFSPEAVDAGRPFLDGFDVEKGTVRFQPGAPPSDDAIRAMMSCRRDQIDG
ncbi:MULTISPECIES: iron chaperone [Gordonia]|uniref:iron chaperone n=1 Tax=Gordonia TaxID=2053 RepID=UPI0033991E81